MHHKMFTTRDLTVTMRWGYALVQQVGLKKTAIMKPDILPDAIVLRAVSWHKNYDEAFGVLHDIVSEAADREAEQGEEPPPAIEMRAISSLPWILRRRRERTSA